ncbi:MAG: histidine kinase [Desulfobacteraceae bacterium]|nr:MAG: histidine kinase [Desulfobacteraceae bacterium]
MEEETREICSMADKAKPHKIVFILTLTVIITIIHYASIREHSGYHFLHRELYFIPILLTALWFGLWYSFLAALAISALYVPHVVYSQAPENRVLTVGMQVLIFNLVAVMMGWLVDRQKKEHEKALESENLAVLGRAAGVVGDEMKYLLGGLKKLAEQVKGRNGSELEQSLEAEVERMERIFDVLASFVPEEQRNLISCGVNTIVRDQADRHRESLRKSGIRLELMLDKADCPTMMDPKQIERVLKNLIHNAAEVSTSGQTISIRSGRADNFCRIEVQDQGPGIRPEHLPKIFTPFFTTKERGQGLALASSKKILRDMGGDIHVASTWGKGAIFTLEIPCDCPDRSSADGPIRSIIEGRTVSQF